MGIAGYFREGMFGREILNCDNCLAICKMWFSFNVFCTRGCFQKTTVVSLPQKEHSLLSYRNMRSQHFPLQIPYLVLKSRECKNQ